MQMAVNAFRKTRIYLYNQSAFSPSDFATAKEESTFSRSETFAENNEGTPLVHSFFVLLSKFF